MADNQEPKYPVYSKTQENQPPIQVVDETGQESFKFPIKFALKKPDDPTTGKERDQTHDAADHMRYAHSLGLVEFKQRERPRLGRALIVGGGPTVKSELENIRELAKDPNNIILAVNWTHTWLLNNGIVPHGCVFFEIDAEPDTVLEAPHPDITYYICSHCHPKTFDSLKGYKRVMWHTTPNSEPERVVAEELFPNSRQCPGGVSTFTRALILALDMGFRHIDLFGIDGSFPVTGRTHVDGYETIMDAKTDGMDIWAKCLKTGAVRQFRTLGYLALQVEEFKCICELNHAQYSLRVHGDSLMAFVHRQTYADQYDY